MTIKLQKSWDPQPSDAVLVSDWDAGQGKLTKWSWGNVTQSADGVVSLRLSKNPSLTGRLYIGGELQQNKTRAQFGNWKVVAKAPKMQPGVIWSPLFTYQHNGTDKSWEGDWREFDFEFVGTKGLQLATHMTGADGQTKHVGHGTFALDFDPSEVFATYELECRETYTAFKVNGKEIFRATPENVGAWNAATTVAFVDLWMTEAVGWAGDHTQAVLPIEALVSDIVYTPAPVVVTPPAPVEPDPVVVTPDPVVVEPPSLPSEEEYVISGTVGPIAVNLIITRSVK